MPCIDSYRKVFAVPSVPPSFSSIAPPPQFQVDLRVLSFEVSPPPPSSLFAILGSSPGNPFQGLRKFRLRPLAFACLSHPPPLSLGYRCGGCRRLFSVCHLPQNGNNYSLRISNATISVTNVEDASRSTKLLAQTTLRNILGTKTLAEMLSDREAISLQMQVRSNNNNNNCHRLLSLSKT